MKKIRLLFLTLFLNICLPLNIFAYSDKIIVGGESVGIEIKSDGIMVVGFYKINNTLSKGNPNIKVGDKIMRVNGAEVNSSKELAKMMEQKMKNNKVVLTIKRNEKLFDTELELIYQGGNYKTGLYVKDSISGIGTLTYIDPETKIYGALGHEIIESNSQTLVEVKTGSIFRSDVTSIDRSVRGTPGGKNAKFYTNDIYGNINKNTYQGIYGMYTGNLPKLELYNVAKIDEIKLGKAYIYTVLENTKLGKYEIEILKTENKKGAKDIYFKVTDKTLLEKTGGIVQGMSGSPIVQGNNIIGAVTHVVISDPTMGYGISIITMLEEGEK